MATVTLNARRNLAAATGAGDDATHWGFYTALNGGDFIIGGENTDDTNPLAIGQNFYFDANSIVMTITASVANRLSEAGAIRLLNGLISGGLFLAAHSGDTGNTGANEITGNGIGRVQVTEAQFTVA